MSVRINSRHGQPRHDRLNRGQGAIEVLPGAPATRQEQAAGPGSPRATRLAKDSGRPLSELPSDAERSRPRFLQETATEDATSARDDPTVVAEGTQAATAAGGDEVGRAQREEYVMPHEDNLGGLAEEVGGSGRDETLPLLEGSPLDQPQGSSELTPDIAESGIEDPQSADRGASTTRPSTVTVNPDSEIQLAVEALSDGADPEYPLNLTPTVNITAIEPSQPDVDVAKHAKQAGSAGDACEFDQVPKSKPLDLRGDPAPPEQGLAPKEETMAPKEQSVPIEERLRAKSPGSSCLADYRQDQVRHGTHLLASEALR